MKLAAFILGPDPRLEIRAQEVNEKREFLDEEADVSHTITLRHRCRQRLNSRTNKISMANSAAKQYSQALDAEAEIAPRKRPAKRPRQQSCFATPIRISKPFSGHETRTSTAPLLRDAPWHLGLEGESVTLASTVD